MCSYCTNFIEKLKVKNFGHFHRKYHTVQLIVSWCLCQTQNTGLDWMSVWVYFNFFFFLSSDQIRLVAQSCPTLCDPMNHSTSGLPVHHQLPEFTETHIHWVSDAIQPSHLLLSPSPLAPNPSQHQNLFQWVNSLHEVTEVLEFQL